MSSIKIKEFVSLLGFSEEIGRKHGWLEEKDILFSSDKLVRKDAARIIHEFIKREMNEKDTGEYKEALLLKDIYDCHVCVNHIAQVYSKGIMDAEWENGVGIFQNNEEVSEEDAIKYTARIFDRSIRRVVSKVISDVGAKRVFIDETLRPNVENEHRIFIDVRPAGLIERDGKRFENCIPFTEIVKKGKKALGDLLDPQAEYYLYCENGYLSEVAANALKNDGVEEVFYFGQDK